MCVCVCMWSPSRASAVLCRPLSPCIAHAQSCMCVVCFCAILLFIGLLHWSGTDQRKIWGLVSELHYYLRASGQISAFLCCMQLMQPAFVALSTAFIGCDYKGNTQQLQESGRCNLEVAVLRGSIEESLGQGSRCWHLSTTNQITLKREARVSKCVMNFSKRDKNYTHLSVCVFDCVVWNSTLTTGWTHLPEVFGTISRWQKYPYSHCGRRNSADGVLFVYVSLTSSIGSLSCSMKPAPATLVDSASFWILRPSAHLKPNPSWWYFLLHVLLPVSFNELKMHLVKNAPHSKDVVEFSLCCIKSWRGNERRHQLVESRREISRDDAFWKSIIMSYLHMAWWWATSLPNFPCFFSAVMMTVLAASLQSRRCHTFPAVQQLLKFSLLYWPGEQLPTIPWWSTTDDKRALRAQDFFLPSLSLWLTWPHRHKQHW